MYRVLTLLRVAATIAALSLVASPRLMAADEEPSPPGSGYVADLAALNATWPGEPPLETVEDAFRVRVVLGERVILTDTHLFAGPVNVIPYHNEDQVTDASGRRIDRGDSVIARYFPPGEIGFAIKHHRSRYRTLGASARTHAMKEELKLRDSHIEMVIGVERDGAPGAITLSSPQGYERGRFGTVKYPMIFVKPVFPGYLTAAQKDAFRDNIRAMMVGLSAVAKFPTNYYGGDPLAASDSQAVRQHAAMMVRAIAGDEEARAWFRQQENLLYCAELAYLASSAGLLAPLNARTFVPLVGRPVWDQFERQLDAHQRGKPSAFTLLNENVHVALVELRLAPGDLRPVSSYGPGHPDPSEGLAFQPMTVTDMVQLFLQIHVPRESRGEELAPLQGALLDFIRPAVLEALGIHRLPSEDPRRQSLDAVLDEIRAVLGTPHGSYSDFRARLNPLLAQARCISARRGARQEDLFIPPSLFHLVARGVWPGGLLELRYVGHGLHFSLVRSDL